MLKVYGILSADVDKRYTIHLRLLPSSMSDTQGHESKREIESTDFSFPGPSAASYSFSASSIKGTSSSAGPRPQALRSHQGLYVSGCRQCCSKRKSEFAR